MGKIVIIDDDPNMEILIEALEIRGHIAVQYRSLNEAKMSIAEIRSAGLIILDIRIPITIEENEIEHKTDSIKFLLELRKDNSIIPVIIYSAIQDIHIMDAIREMPCVEFQSKWDGLSLAEFTKRIDRLVGDENSMVATKTFIVHGHDDKEKLSLKNYLQNVLKLPEPIILHEQASRGLTVMEKLEQYSQGTNLVFVILTPDDIGANATDANETKYRARQNVIFEMGYSLGVFGRKSGRIVLLYKGQLELPSDLSGIVYINIDNGIEAAGEEIRREVNNARN